MSLKYSLTFLMLAVVAVFAGAAAWDVIGWFAAGFFHVAVSFTVLSAAYAGAGPGLLRKRPSGRRSIWGWLLLGPYFLLNAATFCAYRLLSHEPPYTQVAPKLFFGRRLSKRETEAVGWAGVLDLAGEFSEARPLRTLRGYLSLPVLDATAPTAEQLRSAVVWIERAVGSGPVYVHCALGHGRSACVVVAYLLETRAVATVTEGVELLQSVRPGVRLHKAQRRAIRAFLAGHADAGDHAPRPTGRREEK